MLAFLDKLLFKENVIEIFCLYYRVISKIRNDVALYLILNSSTVNFKRKRYTRE